MASANVQRQHILHGLDPQLHGLAPEYRFPATSSIIRKNFCPRREQLRGTRRRQPVLSAV